MKKRQLLASLAVGTAMVAMAAPVAPSFEVKTDVAFASEMTAAGTLAWADYNNDGLMDYFIVAGQGQGPHVGLYRQEADGTFTNVTEETELFFAQLSTGAAAWIDYDNDGCLDLIVAGRIDGAEASTSMTYFFHNEGPSGNYNLVEDYDVEDLLPQLSPDGQDCKGILFAAADFDNDGWTDLLITGYAPFEENKRYIGLFRNTQNGSFELLSNPEFVSMSGTTVYAADFNNDGLMDFVIGGYNDDMGDAGTPTVYLNDGDMTFTPVTGFGFGSHQGTLFPIDVNNDGKMDIIETGRSASTLSWGHVARVYINNGDGTSFTSLDETATGLAGSNSSVGFGDINNDGWMDYMSIGWCNGSPVKLYLNNGDNTFTDATEVYPDAARARDGDITFVDYNNDGKLDISLFGYRDGGGDTPDNPTWPNYLVVNTSTFAANAAPTVPQVSSVAQDGNDVVLTWQASTDDTTPSEAIRYNVYAKGTDGKIFCLSPADLSTGFLRVNRTNALLNTLSYRFKGMNINDYTFGVQAVDNGFRASAFANATAGVNAVKSANVKTFVANGEINIVNSSDAVVSYAVYSVNGAQVAAGNCAANGVAEVALQGGVYVVKVNAVDGVAVDKVVL